MRNQICTIDGCEKFQSARGWCSMHYERWRKYGDTSRGKPTARERLLAKVDTTGTCWLWTGFIADNGYGGFSIGYSRVSAHRASYELFVGPIPEGLVIDHLCRVRHCVNPDHLEAVTQSVNVSRGSNFNRDKTHCPQGHEYTPENVIRKTVDGGRSCRTCNREKCNARYAKKVGRAA